MSVSHQDLEEVYRQSLEDEIIENIAKIKHLDLRKAMDIYYHSQLAKQINEGAYGIQYLSANYLANDLIENEPEIFD